jgi:phosphatidylinositol 4-kinase
LRNDLEFYIPQLCTFLLFGEVKAIEEFFVFLCKVCNASFFFAHRVHWFLLAMIKYAQEKKQEIIVILKMVNTLFKSESRQKKNKLEKFYIANSDPYIEYIKNNDLFFLYDNKLIQEKGNILDKIDYNSLNFIQQQIYNKYKDSRETIINYSEEEFRTVRNKEMKKLQEKGKSKIDISNENENKIGRVSSIKNTKFKPNDFFIDISNFELNNADLTYEEEDDDMLEEEELPGGNIQNDLYKGNNNDFINLRKTLLDINFVSYHSSLNFIDHLCDISNDLPKHPIEEQMLFLYEQLNIINKKLPCNVYLPFLKDSARNYIICHIPLDGVKIFRTKTRCPIMLTFEIIRMDEINKEIQNEEERIEQAEKIRSKSISSANSNLSLEYFGDKNKKKKKELNDIITYDESKDYNNADYDLSKPVSLRNKDNSGKKSSKKVDDNSSAKINQELGTIIEKAPKNDLSQSLTLNIGGLELDDNDKKYRKIVNKFKNKNNLFRNLDNSKTVFEKKMPLLDDNEIRTVNSKGLANKLIQKNKEENKESTDIDTSLKNISGIEQNELLPQENEVTILNKSYSINEINDIFGETFEQKEINIKKDSLFGKFKSHRLFRCIFKTHEDLRQEQFATQLINEFNQIFKIEKVNCWLNTYEIISTGNDAGLVEMVNNSLSLDQLKQKLNNIPLRDFYLHKWGRGVATSNEYKRAMNNFVSSLAGYSLVCYFLQIKDRHNGNILIDNEGHLTHIDFGFLLSNAPGKGLKFENAPFKLSADMVDCLGGVKGHYFDEFRKLLKKGFLAINKHRQKIIILVEMMWCGHGRNLDCFEKGQDAINELKLRLDPRECHKKADYLKFVDSLIEQSVDNWRTKWYDIFQYYVQGIFY